MRKLLIASLALAASACSYVTAAQPASSAVSGEGWYVKMKFILILPISADIYYCPKDTPTQCTKAAMR